MCTLWSTTYTSLSIHATLNQYDHTLHAHGHVIVPPISHTPYLPRLRVARIALPRRNASPSSVQALPYEIQTRRGRTGGHNGIHAVSEVVGEARGNDGERR
jgi:hypothetical protein